MMFARLVAITLYELKAVGATQTPQAPSLLDPIMASDSLLAADKYRRFHPDYFLQYQNNWQHSEDFEDQMEWAGNLKTVLTPLKDSAGNVNKPPLITLITSLSLSLSLFQLIC